MIKIDSIDKKILFHLLQDSRQSLKTIGKKVRISREFASYRIRRLIRKGIITKFTTNINTERLGYSGITIYFKFKNTNPTIQKEIIDFFQYHPLTYYVSSLEGIYDFQVELYMGEASEAEAAFDEMIKKFHRYLSIEFSVGWIRGIEYNYPFLLNETVNSVKSTHWNWGASLVPIDEIDFKILKELTTDARLPTKNIANKLNSTVSIITHRIKKLVKLGVINKYTINVDWSKIGYRWFHLQIALNDIDKKNEIMNFIQKNPHLIRILKGVLYRVDIHCTYLLKNVEQLRTIIEGITAAFPEYIADYHFYSTYKIHKFHYMIPKLIYTKNLFNKAKIR